jgi:hypothetical protein
LAVVAFVVYNANLRSISSADTFPTRYLPISIIKERNFDLDEFAFLQDTTHLTPGFEETGIPYYLQYRRGHYVSTYPIMPALLATPLYIVPVALGLTDGPTGPDGYSRTEVVGTMLSKFASSAAIAISVALVYLTLLRYGSRSAALWIALVYAFATSSWSVSSQGIWQTTISQAFLAGTLYARVRARDTAARSWIVWAGVCLALAVASRPPAVFFALLFTLYVFRVHRRHLVAFLAIPFIIAGLLLTYNHYYFGTILGGYGGQAPLRPFSPLAILEGFLGLLVSPNRGMLVFSPVLLVAFAGLVMTLRSRRDPLLQYTAIATLITIILYSFAGWAGAFSFSYRLLVDLLPALVLYIPLTWDWVGARRWRRGAFVGLALFSVGIQVVGAFFYPCGWYQTTFRNPEAGRRFFDWRDLEVVQCVRAGPVDPDGLRFLRNLLAGAQSPDTQ